MMQVPVNFIKGIVLIYLQDGRVAFSQNQMFRPTIDTSSDKEVKGDFFDDAIVLYPNQGESIELEFNVAYDYKTMPLLKQYLAQQGFVNPLQAGV